MNYTDDPSMVRVVFFKPSGKWHTTEAVQWLSWNKETLMHDAFKEALKNHFKDDFLRLSNMDAICLNPYRENNHPVQLKSGSWIEKNSYEDIK